MHCTLFYNTNCTCSFIDPPINTITFRSLSKHLLVKIHNIHDGPCCILRPAFGCCALQMLVEIVIFSIFNNKKLKKQEICSKFLQKTRFFKFAPKRRSTVLLPKNNLAKNVIITMITYTVYQSPRHTKPSIYIVSSFYSVLHPLSKDLLKH